MPGDRLAPVVLVVLVLAVFAGALVNGFTFDDDLIIVHNRLITRLANIPSLIARPYWAGTPVAAAAAAQEGQSYRPLVIASYALNHAAGGLRPFGYHLVNVLLHAAVTWVFYVLARGLGTSPGGSLAAAAVFAVHPLHTEAVTGVVGRAELLMALGMTLALVLHLQGRTAWALVASAGALLSKEQAAVFPVLVVLADAVRRTPPIIPDGTIARPPSFAGEGGTTAGRPLSFGAVARARWRAYLGYALLVIGYLALRWAVLGGVIRTAHAGPAAPLIDNPLAQADATTRILTALEVAGRYLWLVVWPARLSADYSYHAIPLVTSLLAAGVLAAVAAWGALLLLGVAAWRRRSAAGAFAVGLTVIAFLPASNLLVVSGTIMGERLFYLPLAGPCLLLGVSWDALAPRLHAPGASRWAAAASLGVLGLGLAALGARTVARNADWRDNATLFASAARVVPGSAKVWNNLARTGTDPGEVIADAERALRIHPPYGDDPDLLAVYGSALARAGRIDEAITRLERAAAFGPLPARAAYNLGFAYTRKRRWADAEAMFRRALAMEPRNAATYNALSLALRAQGHDAEALGAAASALGLAPGMAEAHYNWGRAAEELGRTAEARRAYEEALRASPGFALARERLGALSAPAAPARPVR